MIQNGITIIADEGKTFVRISDNFRMGDTIQLGLDYSTGEEREDKPEYYREEDKTQEELDTEKKAENPEDTRSKKKSKR